MKDVPTQYKPLTDRVILAISDEVEKIIPIIDELGDSLEFELGEHTVTIKRNVRVVGGYNG